MKHTRSAAVLMGLLFGTAAQAATIQVTSTTGVGAVDTVEVVIVRDRCRPRS